MSTISTRPAPVQILDRGGDVDLGAWVEQFHRDGFLIVQNVLPPEHIAALKAEMDRDIGPHREDNPSADLHLRSFETSDANLRLFDLDPIAAFAEKLIGDDRGERGADYVHVVHNNSFRTHPGQGISGWHSDEPPYYLVTDGKPPTNVRLPVMLFTCNYYLTDVTELSHGPTQFVPGSHLFGAKCPDPIDDTPYAERVVSAYGAAGTALLFSCQTWHRGAPNLSDRVRYVTQVSYASRIIGHRFFPFMNYQMPEHVYADASPRLRRLLGFVPAGPYG